MVEGTSSVYTAQVSGYRATNGIYWSLSNISATSIQTYASATDSLTFNASGLYAGTWYLRNNVYNVEGTQSGWSTAKTVVIYEQPDISLLPGVETLNLSTNQSQIFNLTGNLDNIGSYSIAWTINNSSYTTTNLTSYSFSSATNATYYIKVRLTTSFSVVYSNMVTVVVSSYSPVIGTIGGPIALMVNQTGTYSPNITYYASNTWFIETTTTTQPTTGAEWISYTGSSFNYTPSSAGTKYLWVKALNSNGTTISSVANAKTVTVTAAPTPISTAAEFAYMSTTGNYILTNDINLGTGWTGNFSTEWVTNYYNTFSGILDGNGYTITYTYASSPHSDDLFETAGLFNYLDGATIKNLTVNGTINITATTGWVAVGILAGYSSADTNYDSSSEITNVKTTGSIYINSTHSQEYTYVGGIVGGGGYYKFSGAGDVYKYDLYSIYFNCGANITSSINEASITVYGLDGGSTNTNYPEGVIVGGIAGNAKTITGCVNKGTIFVELDETSGFLETITGSITAGGVVGQVANIYYSYNTANITIHNFMRKGTWGRGDVYNYIGGIVGNLSGSQDDGFAGTQTRYFNYNFLYSGTIATSNIADSGTITEYKGGLVGYARYANVNRSIYNNTCYTSPSSIGYTSSVTTSYIGGTTLAALQTKTTYEISYNWTSSVYSPYFIFPSTTGAKPELRNTTIDHVPSTSVISTFINDAISGVSDTYTFSADYYSYSTGASVELFVNSVSQAINTVTSTGYTYFDYAHILTGSMAMYTRITDVNGIYRTSSTLSRTVDYHILQFQNEAGTTLASNKQLYTGQVIGTLTTPSKTGYTFSSWKIDGLTISAATIYNYTSSKIAIANWTPINYTVTFDAQSGTIASNASWTGSGSSVTKTVTYDSAVGTIPTSSQITKLGYDFGGWYTSTNGVGTPITSTTTYNYQASNDTLYAYWTPSPYTPYVVNHYLMEADATYNASPTYIDNLTGTTGAQLTLANLAHTYSYYTYDHGTVSGSTVTSTTILADGSRIINLYYTRNTYSISYSAGFTASTASVRYIRAYANGSTADGGTYWVEIQAYTAAGTNVANVNNYPGVTATSSYLVDGVIASTPYYTNGYVSVDLGATYSIDKLGIWHFFSDGRAFYDVRVQVSVDNLKWTEVYSAYDQGLYSASAAGLMIDLGTNNAYAASPLSQSYIFGATFALRADTYTKTFNVSNTNSTYGITGSGTYTLPYITRLGYTFNGWRCSSDSVLYAGGATFTMPGANVTMTPEWTTKTYNITYDENGGSSISDDTFTVESADKTLNTSITRTGYTFNGWKVTTVNDGAVYKELGTFAVVNDMIETIITGSHGSVTVTAQWTGLPYTVAVYKSLDGYLNNTTSMGAVILNGTAITASPTEKSVTYNTTASFSVSLNSGYTFLGWFKNGSSTAESTNTSFSFNYADAANMTMLAKFTDNGNPGLGVVASAGTTTAAPSNANVTVTATATDNYLVEYLETPNSELGVMTDDNLVDYTTWNLGTTGSQSGWSANGTTAENTIVSTTNPWSGTDTAWATLQNDIASDADGGFDATAVPVSDTSSYRFSIWIRRENYDAASGRTYFGLNAYSSADMEYQGVGIGSTISVNRSLTTSDPQTNHYFHNRVGSDYVSLLTGAGYSTDEWLLWVGYAYAYNTTETTNNPEAGIYASDGTKLYTSSYFTVRWYENTTSARIRSYLYYSTDTDEHQYFYRPRIDLLDGTEPTIEQLIGGVEAPNVIGGTSTDGTAAITATTTGTYQFIATDYAGNSTTVSRSVYIDKAVPTITTSNSTYNIDILYYNLPSFDFMVDTTASDVDYANITQNVTSSVVMSYYKADGVTSTTSGGAVTELQAGRNVVVKYDYTDAAGNSATTKTITFSYTGSIYWENYRLAPSSGDGSSGSPYQISSAGNLAWLAYQTNNYDVNGHTDADTDRNWSYQKYFVLTSNISLSGRYWTHIGWYYVNTDHRSFMGNFNGQGYTISGLTINSSYLKQYYAKYSLFGTVTDALIQNFNLADVNISVTNKYVAGIASTNYWSTIQNITVSGSISGTDWVGGIVADNRYSDSYVINCINNATITGASNVGGIIGASWEQSGGVIPKAENCVNNGTISGTGNSVGGIVGKLEWGDIINCTNNGTVLGLNYVGGIVGLAEDNSDETIGRTDYLSTVSGNENTNTVTARSGGDYIGGIAGRVDGDVVVTNCSNTGIVTGDDYTGGVVGGTTMLLTTYTVKPIINQSYNTAAVNGSNYVGGVVGYNVGTMEKTFNTGNVAGSASRVGGVVGYQLGGILNTSYNTGHVFGVNYIGGVVGVNTSSSSVTDCYAVGDVGGTSYIGGLAGLVDTSTLTNCYFNNSVTVPAVVSGSLSGSYTITSCSGYSSSAMKSQDTYSGFDFANPGDWAMGGSINNGYPVLQTFNSSVSIITFKTTGSTTYATRTIVNGQTIGTDSLVNSYNMPAYPVVTGYEASGLSTTDGGAVNFYYNTAISSSYNVYVIWTAKTHTLTLNAQSGTITANGSWTGSGSSATKTVTYNSAIGTLPWYTSSSDYTISRTGYTFGGWYNDTDFLEQITAATLYNYIDDNDTIYAKWTANNYTLTLLDNNKTATEQSKSVTYNSSLASITTPSYNGYSLNGYYYANDYTATASSSVLASTVYRIMFANGTYSSTQIQLGSIVYFDITFSSLAAFSSIDINDKTISSASYTISGSRIYGSWEVVTGTSWIGTYSFIDINFTSATGVTISSYNRVAISASGATQYYNGSCVSQIATYTTAGNTTLMAKWTPNNYTLIVNPNGGTYNSTTSNTSRAGAYDTSFTIADPTRTGYSFADWTSYDFGGWLLEGYGTVSTFGKILNIDPMFKTGYNSVSVYNNAGLGYVTYNRVAASSDNPTNSSYELAITTNNVDATPELGGFVQTTYSYAGATFYQFFIAKLPVGYNLVRHNNSIGDGSVITWLTSTAGTGEWEVYAIKWQCGTTGIFSSFGHIALNGPEVAPITWYVAYSTMFDATGLTATGMNTSQGFSYSYIANYPSTASTGTLVATWQINKYTIAFDYNHDSLGTYATRSVTYGYSIYSDPEITMPTNPTWSGHTFEGWATTAGDDQPDSTENTVVNASDIWYALWTSRVTFDYNHDALGTYATLDVTYNYSITGDADTTMPANLADRPGYTFGGWSTSSSATVANVSSSTAITTGVTWYAVWNKITYYITYLENGGTLVSDGTYDITSGIITLPTNITKIGYNFGGWKVTTVTALSVYRDASNSYAAVGDIITNIYTGSHSSITLTAQWKSQATISCVYDQGVDSSLIVFVKVSDGENIWIYPMQNTTTINLMVEPLSTIYLTATDSINNSLTTQVDGSNTTSIDRVTALQVSLTALNTSASIVIEVKQDSSLYIYGSASA
ncbi:MAG: InlB B-repeat-containing protein [Spirochaetales bacterium]